LKKADKNPLKIYNDMFWGYVTYVKKLNSIVYIFGLLFRYQVVI